MQVASIHFTYFSTEPDFDKVTLYDGYSMFYSTLAVLSGTLNNSISYYGTQQYMYIHFSTDGTTVAKGFEATLQSLGEIILAFCVKFDIRLIVPRSVYNMHFDSICKVI